MQAAGALEMEEAGTLSGRSGVQSVAASRKAANSTLLVTGEEVKSQQYQRIVTCALHFLCSTLGVFLAIANNETDWKLRVSCPRRAIACCAGRRQRRRCCLLLPAARCPLPAALCLLSRACDGRAAAVHGGALVKGSGGAGAARAACE